MSSGKSCDLSLTIYVWETILSQEKVNTPHPMMLHMGIVREIRLGLELMEE